MHKGMKGVEKKEGTKEHVVTNNGKHVHKTSNKDQTKLHAWAKKVNLY